MTARPRVKATERPDGAPATALNASDRAYQYLRALISDGPYKPGTHLREEDVAAAVGVSRTPIREAIRRLDADGWVELIPNRGAFVIAWTETDLDEIFHLRALLEGYGASLAAERITLEELSRLESLAATMEAALDARSLDDIFELNNQFHDVVSAAARNQHLSTILHGLIELPLVRRTFRRYTDEQLRQSHMQHRELVGALRARDRAWASHVMSAHILGAAKVFAIPEAASDSVAVGL